MQGFLLPQIITTVIVCTSSLTDILFDNNESLTSE